jgi:hypothetical protein
MSSDHLPREKSLQYARRHAGVGFVLAREGILLNQVHPLQTIRWADDAEGAADLAVLLGILITAAERRPSHGRQS